MSCIELFLNSVCYSCHPVFQDIYRYQSNNFATVESILKVSVSFSSLDSNLSSSNLVKEEAKSNCHDGVSSPFLSILGLSSAISRSISVHYPDDGAHKYKLIFNKTIFPIGDPDNVKNIDLLFCFSGKLQPGVPFFPDHYVPLVKFSGKRKSESSISNTKTTNPPTKRIRTMHSYFDRKNDIKDRTFKVNINNNNNNNNNDNNSINKLNQSTKHTISVPPISLSFSSSNSKAQRNLPASTINSLSKSSIPSVPTSNSSSISKYDIATYYLKISKRNTKEELFDFAKNVQMPPSDFIFPSVNKKRAFQYNWLVSYPWLRYSPSLNGGFCLPCCLFKHRIVGFDNTQRLVSKPIFPGNDSTTIFRSHQNAVNSLHRKCMDFYPI